MDVFNHDIQLHGEFLRGPGKLIHQQQGIKCQVLAVIEEPKSE